jgi:putative ABC transport system substrate-binding protein
MVKQRIGAVVVDAALTPWHVADLALRHRLPSVSNQRRFAESGGLMSHAALPDEIYRRAVSYVDKILKGANPADLPVERPTRFELLLNLKTAKALGLTVPPALLQRADQVIE